MNISFFLPFPHTINNYYTKTRNGVYLSNKGLLFSTAGAESIRSQVGPNLFLDTPVCVSVVLYPKDRRVRDLDNYMKPLLDTITRSGIWIDDKIVDQLFIYRGALTPSGSCFVKITGAGPIIANTDEHRAIL